MHALDTILAILEHAESAERAILIYQAEALRALHRAEVAEQRAGSTPTPAPREADPSDSGL